MTRIPCNTPNGPNCGKVVHIRTTENLPPEEWGLLINYDRPCDGGDIEKGVVVFDLWADLFMQIWLPSGNTVILPMGLYKKYCCCVQYIKVFSCHPEPPGCISLYKACNLPDFNPFKQVMTFRSKPGYDHDICAYSIPPDKVDSCGLPAPYWVVSESCAMGCDDHADYWDVPIEELEVKVKDYKPELIHDPDGIFSNRLCLELCGPCYSLFEDCHSCNQDLIPPDGKCLVLGCPGMDVGNVVKIYGNDCYPNCDPSQYDEDNPPPFYAPNLCYGCAEKTSEHTGEEIANDDELYYLPSCGSVNPPMIGPLTVTEHKPCYECNRSLWSMCSDCVGAPVDDPPFHCPSKTYTETKDDTYLRIKGIDPNSNPGYACYTKQDDTNGTEPIPGAYLTDSDVDFPADCCGNVLDEWHNFMCICNANPLGGNPTNRDNPIALPPADFDGGHVRFFPETIEATIEIDNDYINKSVDVRFSSPREIPLPYAQKTIGTQSRFPFIYFLENHGDLESISKQSVSGAFAQGEVPHVNNAIYLGDYLDGDKNRSAWLHVGYCTAQTLVHSKSRVFTFDYSVFSYCKEEPCKELSCLLEPKKTVTFSIK
tara:strand:+ start:6353 stop:8137 length:1785 start_codon:yes stop_codon:yes gene_type:complete